MVLNRILRRKPKTAQESKAKAKKEPEEPVGAKWLGSSEINYRIGTTSGLHYVAKSEDLSNVIRKLGWTLTRGTSVIQVDQDVPHDVTYTDGKEMRKIAEKQGIEIVMHGSLTTPVDIPERSDWRDAHDHMQKSIRSSVFCGSKFVVFHACLNIWLELLTYTSRKLSMSFCDQEGHFISGMLKESPTLREWFVKKRAIRYYMNDMFTNEEYDRVRNRVSIELDEWSKEQMRQRLKAMGLPYEAIERAAQTGMLHDLARFMVNREELAKMTPEQQQAKFAEIEVLEKRVNDELNKLRDERIMHSSEFQKKMLENAMLDKLARGDKWDSEELRGPSGILDGYFIMAHYMFFRKDPIWVDMAKFYPTLITKYKMDYNDKDWLERAWRQAEENNDRVFKEFFYGAVAAKYLEGHLKKITEWINGDLMKELAKFPDGKELQQIAKNLIIAIENPDARDPQHAGLHLLWNINQIYSAIRTIRKTVPAAKNVWILVDFEHQATQGVDPVQYMEDFVKEAPDYGNYCIAIHSNAPNPSHAHETVEIGDVRVYKLLYYLRKTGFGKGRKVYVIYERGGGEDPYKKSINALRLMVNFLAQDIEPSKLPPEFFGIQGAVEGSMWRQRQIIRDHMYEPMKDLMEMPDEEFGMMSTNILKKGKKPEQWKKAEFR